MSATTQFDSVSVITKANVYFDGKCVSHSIVMADGSKKSIGVILPTALPSALPAALKFNTGAAEVMELVEGACRVKLAGSEGWTAYAGGQSFSVAANSSFEIEVTQTLHYVCHFG